MKPISCKRHQNTFLASDETVIEIFTALQTDTKVQVKKIERCEGGGWHIFVERIK